MRGLDAASVPTHAGPRRHRGRAERPAAGPAVRGPSGRSAAFTLIELLVSLALIGLIAAATTIGLGGTRRTKLQDQAFKVSRMSRNALIWALSRATTVRMVIDLDEFRISLEEADAPALVDEAGKLVEPDAGDDADAYAADGGLLPGEPLPGEPLPGEPGLGLPPGDLMGEQAGTEGDESGMGGLFGGGFDLGAMFGGSSALEDLERPPKYRTPLFTPIRDPRFVPFVLEDVKALRVYLPGAEEPIAEGRTYVMYRDDGTADGAVIHIEDAQGRVYAVAIQPLTGRGALYPYPYVPEEPEPLP